MYMLEHVIIRWWFCVGSNLTSASTLQIPTDQIHPT